MAKPTPEERQHMANVAQLPCLKCGRRSTVHHVTAYADRMGRLSRRNDRVVPLCPAHHQIQHGPHDSVEALGHRGFYREHGIDLYAEAVRLWEERNA